MSVEKSFDVFLELAKPWTRRRRDRRGNYIFAPRYNRMKLRLREQIVLLEAKQEIKNGQRWAIPAGVLKDGDIVGVEFGGELVTNREYLTWLKKITKDKDLT